MRINHHSLELCNTPDLNADILDEESYRWKSKWLSIPSIDRAHLLQNALEQ